MDQDAILDREIEARVLARILEERSGGEISSLASCLEDYPQQHWPAVSRAWLRAAGELGIGEIETGSRSRLTADPDLFGAYRVLRELGRGGQGRVFLAEHTGLGRKVALKVLSEAGHLDGMAARRFQREAEVASRLDHPGICTVYESGVHNGTFFIAMQYVEGETLARLIARTREGEPTRSTVVSLPSEATPPSEPTTRGDAPTPTSERRTRPELMRAVELMEVVARALHAAHEAGVLHRDFKPANVMVTPQGQGVIMDFGLARAEDADQPTLTREGDLMGTPAYMAPEQLAAQRMPVDRRADIWALGVTLYESLTLERPFAAPTREALYQQILVKEPPDPRRRDRHLPRDLGTVIATCLDKDPDRRYQTALDVAEDLRRVREREPILARPAGPLLRSLRWAQRQPARAALLVTLLLSLPTIAVLVTLYATSRSAVAFEQDARRREEVESLIERANFLSDEGAEELAQEVYRSALDLEPESAEATAGLVLSHFSLGQYREALAAIDALGRETASRLGIQLLRQDTLEALHPEMAEPDREAQGRGSPRDAIDYYVLAARRNARDRRAGETSCAEALALNLAAIMRAPGRRALYYFQRARIVCQMHDADAAAEVADLLVTLWPGEAKAHMWAGGAYDEAGQRQAAIEQYRAGLGCDPEPDLRGRLHYSVGRSLVALWRELPESRRTDDHLREAMKELRRALPLIEDEAVVHNGLAYVLSELGEEGVALDEVRKALEARPGWAPAHSTLGSLLSRHDPERAMEEYRIAIRLDPTLVAPRQNLGEQLTKAGQYAEAVEVLREVLRRAPHDPSNYFKLAEALKGSGEIKAAIPHYEEARRRSPENARYAYGLGAALVLAGNRDEGLDALGISIELDPHRPHRRRFLARQLYHAKRLEEAISHLRAALELNPAFPEALSDLYQYLNALGRWREALESLERLLEIEPDRAVDRYNFANLQYQLGDVDEALRNWMKALELEATHRLAHDNVVAVLQDRREVESLLAELERWAQVVPDDAENWAILTWTHLQAARRDQDYELGPALEAARRAAKLGGDRDARSLNVLGLILARTGAVEEAIASLEKAAAAARLRDPPDEDFAREIEQQLHRLKTPRDE